MTIPDSNPRRVLVLVLVVLATAAVGARLAAARDASSIGTGVVTVSTRLGYQQSAAAGTGMVLTSSGEILTNNHVIAGATSVSVAVPGTGSRYSARVVGYDVRDDVAVMQLQGASNLKTVSVDGSRVVVGQSVTAVGNAGGTGSLSSAAGRITGTGRSITATSDEGSSERLTGLLETNAGVQPGDSGGPLLSARGGVVGMVTAASTNGRFGFRDVSASDAYAIPIGKALTLARAIESGRASTAIHVGGTAFLGVRVATGDSDGATIVSVVSGGPAARAGLQPGDVVTSLAGHATSTPAAVTATVLGLKPGQRVAVRYADPSGMHTVTVTLASGPPQ